MFFFPHKNTSTTDKMCEINIVDYKLKLSDNEGRICFILLRTQHILFAVVWRRAFVYVLLLLGCLLNKVKQAHHIITT